MILVFGGTTEGKLVASFLNEQGIPFIYSTKTEIEFDNGKVGNYRFGAFSQKDLTRYISQQNIHCIIHAAHPFATELTTTIDRAAQGIPVIRFERHYPERSTHHLVRYVSSYEDAIHAFSQHGNPPLLALTGVQSIPKLAAYWKNTSSYFRILDREVSRNLAEQSSFPNEQLILSYPSKKLDDEIQLFRKLGVGAILTKESGKSGNLSLKIDAAIACEIPIYIIERPSSSKSFIHLNDLQSLREVLQQKKLQ